MKLWLVALITALIPTVICQKCPSGWEQYKYQCYQLFSSNNLNWYESRLFCERLDAELAAAKTNDVHDFLAQLVVPTRQSYWISLNDIGNEGVYKWEGDGELLDETQTHWAPNQPDNNRDNEHCCEMWGDNEGKWNDRDCNSDKIRYICERSLDKFIKCDEPNGWISADSACYKLYDSSYTWIDANNYCNSVGAELISVQTQEEQDHLAQETSAYDANFWIGATDIISGIAGEYTWPDGTNIGPYTNWAAGQPDNRYSSNCAEVFGGEFGTGEWVTASCSYENKFMCEKPEGVCPDGWRILRGHCYQVNTNIQYTWTDSKHFCEAQGAFMVDIQSSLENEFIVSFFDELDNIGISDLWIGVSDVVQDGVFKWSDGSSLDYTNWNTNQPQDLTGYPDCGTINTGSTNGNWTTTNCYGLQSFVCKVPVGQAVKPVLPDTPLGDCPPGWSLNDDSCYYIERSQKYTYVEARDGCKAFGAQLTSILSPDEQSYHSMRVNMLNDQIWIGLNDISDEGNYQWEDGSLVDFVNWAPDQPSRSLPGEDCVLMRSGEVDAGQWDDVLCENTAYYMCKLPKACDEYTSGDTDDEYYYRYHPAQKSVEYIYFEVQADSDVHIGLSSEPEETNPMYEIVIGGLNNTQSAIRRCAQCENEVDVPTPSILNSNEWRGFWITYNMNTGKMDVGKEAQGAFMTYTDPDPIKNATYVGYSTGFGSEGKFRFCNLTDLPTPPPTPVLDPRCGSGWEYDPSTENCYLFAETNYLSWDDAELDCRKHGGNLASIISVEEQTYINGRVKYSSEAKLWIGANDKSVEGGWQWSSGDPYRYLNWNPDEPNNDGGEEHCVQVFTSNGKWNDDVCAAQFGFICKKTGYLTSHFTILPNRLLPGNDQFLLPNMYPDECAKSCVEETTFNCLSFDYNKADMECALSATTGSLNNELDIDINFDYYEKLPDVVPDPEPTSLPPNYRCDLGWAGYGSYCYQVQDEEETMQEASTRCRALKGDLVSIHEANENEFVLNLVVSAGIKSSIWIGLNELETQHLFDWTDGSSVVYTFWNAGEPNNYEDNGEYCVQMAGNGAWSDQDCSIRVPSVCKRMKQDLEPTKFPITPSGCSPGWVGYQYSCYYVEGEEKVVWADAVYRCSAYGGHLVSIADRFEQSLLSSQLGLQNGQLFWIGLNDLITPGEYAWQDGSAVTYTYWDQGQPDDSAGNCVSATSGVVAGFWQDQACTSVHNYVCEKDRLGFTPPPTTPPLPTTQPNNNGCAAGWIGYGNDCFKIDEVRDPAGLMWSDARQHCLNMGADLASFHSKEEEDYIKAQGANADPEAGFWIGLYDSSGEGGFQWTDGSPVDYVAWESGEPDDVGGEDCVQMFFGTRGWNDIDCNSYRSWVCKIPKGVVPYTTPVPPTPSPYPSCPSDPSWMLYGDFCYYFSSSSGTKEGWTEANSYCMEHGGYLVSIHGQDENDFIQDVTTRVYNDYSSLWIGIRAYSVDGTYEWSDSSPVDFVNWQPGEPDDSFGEQKCGQIQASEGDSVGMWSDINCGNKIPFICKKATDIIQPITYPPTPVPVGNCPAGAFKYDTGCYQFFGFSAEDQVSGFTDYEMTDWESAKDVCDSQGMQLATIQSQQMQSYLTTYMIDKTIKYWIGMSDRTDNGNFLWADGTTVDFTNWKSGEPDDYSGESCVELLYNEKDVGKWSNVPCENKNGFICQAKIDPSLPEPTEPPSQCKDNYVQYYDSCFRVLTSEVIFSEAQSACQSDGTDFASIMNSYEQAFVEIQLYNMGNNPLWIGLVDDKVSGEYKWADLWPVWYTNWGLGEPSQGAGEGCVAVEIDGSWDDTDCSRTLMPLCKYSLVPRPTDPPSGPGDCDSDWESYGSFCYSKPEEFKSWPEAEYQCMRYGATVASVHSRQENEYLRKVIASDDSGTNLWLGLERDEVNGGFMWQDGTPVDYVNWAYGEPSGELDGQQENCVEMFPDGYWNDVGCFYDQFYVCKKTKTPLETSKSPTTKPQTTSRITKPETTEPRATTKPVAATVTAEPIKDTGITTGGIIGIVIGIILLVLIVGIIIFFLSVGKMEASSKSDAFEGKSGPDCNDGFSNAAYDDTLDEVKVNEYSLEPSRDNMTPVQE